MRNPYLITRINFPAGVPSRERVHSFLRSAFEEYSWFQPRRYGSAFLDRQLNSEKIDYDVLLAHYAEEESLCVAAQTDRDFFLLHPAKPGVPPFTGGLIWETTEGRAKSRSWQAAHARQVVALMRLFDSPLAYAAGGDDYSQKTTRVIPRTDGLGQTHAYTVRDYSEGLPGVFWRNFYGPPFVEFWGERLRTLAPAFKQDLGAGCVLVQPYELPSLAGTAEGDARERQIIEHLGPECFYDHQKHLKPTRVLELPTHWRNPS